MHSKTLCCSLYFSSDLSSQKDVVRDVKQQFRVMLNRPKLKRGVGGNVGRAGDEKVSGDSRGADAII